jgi:Fic family protein
VDRGVVAVDESSYAPFPAFSQWAAIPFDAGTYAAYRTLLGDARAKATPEELRDAEAYATRTAAVDTGAIEGLYEVDRGFTRTVATQAASWEAALNEKGELAAQAVEDALEAYEYVLDQATRNAGPLTEIWIKQLHATICAHQDTYTVYTEHGRQARPLPKGDYKSIPNSPTNRATGKLHAYASVFDTAPEMRRLVETFQSEDFLAAHPLLQAAYAHYAFVCVHPFADGNGRVARALASVSLYRDLGLPLVVFADQKTDYLDALEAADAGRHALFVNFVAERVLDTIELARMLLARAAGAAGLPAVLTDFERTLTSSHGGLSHFEMDAIGARLFALVQQGLDAAIAKLRLPPGVSFQVGNYAPGVMSIPIPEGYRALHSDTRMTQLTGLSAAPATASQGLLFAVSAVLANRDGPEYLVITQGIDAPELYVRLRELHPRVSAALEIRLDAWADTVVALIMRGLASEADASLRRSGYL